MRAKKSLGQHFLKSERALRAIIEAGRISSSDVVLEIGPGTGILTEKLLETGARVIAIEKDDNLFEFLKTKFKSSRLELTHEDILKFIENSKLKIGNYKLIANIPYNITGAILKKFLSAEYQPELMVLLVQKEVAERVVAREGKESILSLSVKAYGKPKYIETVKAGSFVPRPQVDSAIIKIEDISKEFFKDFTENVFFKLVQAGFKSKRKKLISNLGAICDPPAGEAGKKAVKEAFQELKIDENIRAEDVNMEIWQKLAKYLVAGIR